MYLNQVISALLYTFIRLALQGSMIFFVSHLALRTSNLTYKERINGGSLEAVKFLFFARRSPGRQHTHGRIYLCLALVISFALNYLATLLNYTYPFEPTYLPTNEFYHDVSTDFAKTTTLLPNDTSVESILFHMTGMNGSLFNGYSFMPATRTSCKVVAFEVDCGGEKMTFGGGERGNFSYAFGPQTDIEEKAYPQNATAPDGEVFQFYNGTDTAGTLMLQEAFVNIAKASSTNYSDMSLSSPRSIESCLTRSLGEHRCTRHSLGYLLSRKGHLFVITRRVFTMTHSMQLSQTFNQREIPEFVDPSVNTTIDCRRFPTPTLETLCMRLNFLGVPSFYMLYATQLLTDDKHGRSHWDGVNTQLSTVPVDSTGNRAFVMTVEAIHVDVGVEYYNTTVNRAELNRASKTDELRMQGHEAFEATYYVDNEHLDTYDHSWVDWGYSEDDIHNLTAFLTQGTMLNLGLIILQAPEFLAHVSNLAVILLFSASILMGGAGLLLSFAHDPVPAPETPESGSPELTKQKVSELEKA